MNQSMILNFFGGVSQDGSSWAVDFEKVLQELASWLLPIGICLLAEGFWLEKWRKTSCMLPLCDSQKMVAMEISQSSTKQCIGGGNFVYHSNSG